MTDRITHERARETDPRVERLIKFVLSCGGECSVVLAEAALESLATRPSPEPSSKPEWAHCPGCHDIEERPAPESAASDRDDDSLRDQLDVWMSRHGGMLSCAKLQEYLDEWDDARKGTTA